VSLILEHRMTVLKPALFSTVSEARLMLVWERPMHAALVRCSVLWCSQGHWAPASTKPSHLALLVCVWECWVAIMVPVCEMRNWGESGPSAPAIVPSYLPADLHRGQTQRGKQIISLV
jgi:hypothetical protein